MSVIDSLACVDTVIESSPCHVGEVPLADEGWHEHLKAWMVGRIENPGGLATGQEFRPQPPRTTCSPLNRAWLPMEEAGSLWVRLRVPFARRRFAEEFNAFQAFVLSFSTEARRPLKAGESQAMADDAVLLRLLDVDAVFSSSASSGGRPAFFRTVPGYRRRHAPLRFREWLVLHERQLRAPPTRARVPTPTAA